VLVDADERDRLAVGARAPGAADAVHVVLRHVGQVVVDDARQLRDVDAARGDVGRHEHVDAARLEIRERSRARTLALVAVDRLCADPVAPERLRQLVGAVLGAREHEHLVPAVRADHPRQELALAVAADRDDALPDRLDRRVARRDLDRPRPVEQALGERLDLVGERRREEKVLALRGQQREDAADVGQEAHVEHPVGLVEHEDLDRRQVDVALARVVEQPAGRRDDDVDAALQLRRLRAEADAAEQRHRRVAQVLAVGADRRLDLRGELARRRDHERAHGPAGAGAAVLRVRRRCGGQALQHRQHEAGGLAGAGLRAGEQVAAREHRGDGLRLDRRGGGVTVFSDGAHERVGQAERGERHRCFQKTLGQSPGRGGQS